MCSYTSQGHMTGYSFVIKVRECNSTQHWKIINYVKSFTCVYTDMSCQAAKLLSLSNTHHSSVHQQRDKFIFLFSKS